MLNLSGDPLPFNALVESAWLADHLNAPDLRIVDLRWRGDGSGRRTYLQHSKEDT